MAERFEVGEVAIYVRPGSPYYGREVEILSELHPAKGLCLDHTDGNTTAGGFLVHEITDLCPDVPGRMIARPEHLRKKRPPAREIDRVVSWDDCLWKPQGVTA